MTIELGSPFFLSYVGLWLLVALQTVLLLGLVRMVTGRQSGAGGGRDGDRHGEPAPDFDAVDLDGRRHRGRDLAGRLRALVFVSPTCEACTLTMDELDALGHKAEHQVLVVCRGLEDQCREMVREHEVRLPVVADVDRSLNDLFGISSVPTAVLIDPDDRIRSYGTPLRGDEFERLLAAAEPAGSAPDADLVGER